MEALKNHIQQHINIERTALDLLEPYFEHRVLKKKEIVLAEGQVCREKFFVAKGCLQMFFVKPNGIEQTIDFALEHWWTTDFSAFGKHVPSQYTIRSIEPTELYVLSVAQQTALLEALPAMEQYFHRILHIAYAASQHRVKYLYQYSREELYRQFAAQFPAFVQRVPQYMLASFLGFTPEYLSEIRKKPVP
ncbi:CRP-like cAMP-binding protein [Chitinophaga skermanii]|uniref:CRP-like cAMP-binding protein n=1 Tax=Chitinophaga skermanii TaxID=331697 RepID=A0A327QTL4_9BACT|nr:Crp/Fnr family transcriptional regulator [Chitinophaga skermanii]RAJ07004.1 CRP-like cAMP-binding protein [Chitinophaga skermanii]